MTDDKIKQLIPYVSIVDKIQINVIMALMKKKTLIF